MMTAGTVSTGSASSTPVVSRPIAVSAVATVAVGWPDCTSTRPCATPPAAAPPGSTLAAAFPTTCEVAAAAHGVCGRETRTSTHSAAKLASSSPASTRNHQGRTPPRSGQAPISVMTLGSTT